MAACDKIITGIITDLTDIRGSTEANTHGTKVTITCGDGYTVDGEDSITCNNGAWKPAVPTCKVGSASDTSGFNWENMTSTDRIVLLVCVSVAALVLIILVVLCILYHNKKTRLGKQGDTKRIIKHQETHINYIGSHSYDEDDGYSEYSVDNKYHGKGGYGEDPYRRDREDPYRRDREDPYRRDREDPYRGDNRRDQQKDYRDDYYSSYKDPRRAQSLDRFQHDRVSYPASSFQGYRTGPVRLDTKRANWHDRYDQTRSSQMPRVHSTGHVPNHPYRGDYYTYR